MYEKYVESEWVNCGSKKGMDKNQFKMADTARHIRSCRNALYLAHHVIAQFSHCA